MRYVKAIQAVIAGLLLAIASVAYAAPYEASIPAIEPVLMVKTDPVAAESFVTETVQAAPHLYGDGPRSTGGLAGGFNTHPTYSRAATHVPGGGLAEGHRISRRSTI